jgi:hypothetical protein
VRMGSGSRSCQIAGFGISGVDTSGYQRVITVDMASNDRMSMIDELVRMCK